MYSGPLINQPQQSLILRHGRRKIDILATPMIRPSSLRLKRVLSTWIHQHTTDEKSLVGEFCSMRTWPSYEGMLALNWQVYGILPTASAATELPFTASHNCPSFTYLSLAPRYHPKRVKVSTSLEINDKLCMVAGQWVPLIQQQARKEAEEVMPHMYYAHVLGRADDPPPFPGREELFPLR